MTNKDLQDKYEDIYKNGPEAYHSMTTEDVTEQVVAEFDWNGKRVLEVGCGLGRTANAIAEAGGVVLATDYSKEAIKSARAEYGGNPKVNFVTSLAGPDRIHPFDVVVAQELLEHLDNPQIALMDWQEYLPPGGYMIVTCPSFLNVRGYVWMTLSLLMDVPMSLTDLHYVTPWDMERWARASGMVLEEWRTFRFDMAGGQMFMDDMKKRLTNALNDAAIRVPEHKINSLLRWMNNAAGYQAVSDKQGAGALYRLRKE